MTGSLGLILIGPQAKSRGLMVFGFFTCRSRAVPARGKSTSGFKKVYVVIPKFMFDYLDQLAAK